MSKLFEQATQSNQYDTCELVWPKEGDSESTRTRFFWEYLEPYSRTWEGKSVLDVGAGTGWLVARALECGAIKAVGIELSAKNVTYGKNLHPDLDLREESFEDFDNAQEKFDEIIGIMSFSHMADIESTFRKLHLLLKEGGRVIIVVPDYEYFKTSPHGESLEIQVIDDEQYAVAVTKSTGTLADIVRKTIVYKRVAENVGLELIEEKEMKPTDNQIAHAPKFNAIKDTSLTRLLVFSLKA